MSLPIKRPTESVIVSFDFSSELDLVDSAVVSVDLVGGYDANPAAFLDGVHQLSGAEVLQRITAGVANADYKLTAVATRGSDVIERSGTVQVRKA